MNPNFNWQELALKKPNTHLPGKRQEPNTEMHGSPNNLTGVGGFLGERRIVGVKVSVL